MVTSTTSTAVDKGFLQTYYIHSVIFIEGIKYIFIANILIAYNFPSTIRCNLVTPKSLLADCVDTISSLKHCCETSSFHWLLFDS